MRFFILGLIVVVLVSCQEKFKKKGTSINLPNYEKLARLDVALAEPIDGDWMKQHLEAGQTFEQYLAKNPVTISNKRTTIYLQPIGAFTPLEQKMLDYTAEYVGYFFGLRTIMLEPISADVIPDQRKRIQFETQQLDASYIIRNVLPDEIPGDGIVIMGLTAQDLYPKPEWNYVFGLASYVQRTAVTSMFRFADPTFSDENYSLCLSRLIKTSTHEIGHMFTIAHCTHASCLMNGSNHIVELDSSPNALCSVCLAKLSWNLEFDNNQRFEKLISFCTKHQLKADALLLQKQYNAIK